MAGLKQIKLKIRSVQKTGTVTKAMEAVSAAKMRKAQQQALSGRAYARASAAVLGRVSGSRELGSHPLVQVRPITNAHYIVITSDKGLAGALSGAVLRAAVADISALGLPAARVAITAVGRKANDFFSKRGYTMQAFHPNTDQVTSAFMYELVHAAGALYQSGAVDTVRIVYQNFISTFEQRPTLRTVYPLSLGELMRVVGDIVPARGVFAAQGRVVESTTPSTYTIEPTEAEVLGAILPKLAAVIVYHALLESQASEHSARMVAMKSASDKASELTHALTLKFNKARQAVITREVSEITGGMEAMATQ